MNPLVAPDTFSHGARCALQQGQVAAVQRRGLQRQDRPKHRAQPYAAAQVRPRRAQLPGQQGYQPLLHGAQKCVPFVAFDQCQ